MEQLKIIQSKDNEHEPSPKIGFGSFVIGENDINEIAGIQGSLVQELADIFIVQPEKGWSVEALGELIAKIGPAKQLQDNLSQAELLLPGKDGVQIAINWVKNSGLLEPVFRNFNNPNIALPNRYETVVITGGVRNWMTRRANLMLNICDQIEIGEVLIAAGNRQMNLSEGLDVQSGDTEASFFERELAPKLKLAGFNVRFIAPQTAKGEEIAIQVAHQINEGPVLVACNAGNWVQNGGQISRSIIERRSKDIETFVISDAFSIAENGEPASVAQNPLTAVGILARNLQELQRHVK